MAGALVNWQFSRERPHLLAAKNLITTHTGSVALGSFLTAFLGVFKFELDEADVCILRCSVLRDRGKTSLTTDASIA